MTCYGYISYTFFPFNDDFRIVMKTKIFFRTVESVESTLKNEHVIICFDKQCTLKKNMHWLILHFIVRYILLAVNQCNFVQAKVNCGIYLAICHFPIISHWILMLQWLTIDTGKNVLLEKRYFFVHWMTFVFALKKKHENINIILHLILYA